MGSITSKPSTGIYPVQNNEPDMGSNPDDPRSPTPEIMRTPLNGKPGAKHNITKNADLRKTFDNINGEEKLIHNNPILSAVIKNHLQSFDPRRQMQDFDPRSPTQDFERTPIIIASKIEELSDKKDKELLDSPCFFNDNAQTDSCDEAKESPEIVPKNLCNDFYDMTLDDTIKESEEPLGSSTASTDIIEQNMNNDSLEKPTKLLETNFDYVDTGKSEKIKYSPTKKLGLIPRLKILENDPRSPSVGIERTPIVVAKAETDDSTDANVEEMSDDSLIKVLQSTNAELRQSATKEPNQEGLMIYEDETDAINVTPKKSKSNSNSGSRTPLSCMRNKGDAVHARSKSANNFFDPKKLKVPSEKSPKKHVSHIPRLKSLTKQPNMVPSSSSISLKSLSKSSAISGDCENTPPNSHRDLWDKDNSIVL